MNLDPTASRLASQGVAYAPQIASAARRHGLDPELLAAVAAQETGGPGSNAGRNVVGDGGHGHGLFQIDDRWHAFARTPEAMDPGQNADYAAGMLSGLAVALRRKRPSGAFGLQCRQPGRRPEPQTQWRGGRDLGYADSVLEHYARLDGGAIRPGRSCQSDPGGLAASRRSGGTGRRRNRARSLTESRCTAITSAVDALAAFAAANRRNLSPTNSKWPTTPASCSATTTTNCRLNYKERRRWLFFFPCSKGSAADSSAARSAALRRRRRGRRKRRDERAQHARRDLPARNVCLRGSKSGADADAVGDLRPNDERAQRKHARNRHASQRRHGTAQSRRQHHQEVHSDRSPSERPDSSFCVPIAAFRRRDRSRSAAARRSDGDDLTADQQAQIAAQHAAFDFEIAERAELLREHEALQALLMEQLKNEDEIMKKWISLI